MPQISDINDLQCRFQHVSFLDNRETPEAVHIPAEAFDIARARIDYLAWFKADQDRPNFIDSMYELYDGEGIPHHRISNRKSDQGKLSFPDFYITWRTQHPILKDVVPAAVPRAWQPQFQKTVGEIKEECKVYFNDERLKTIFQRLKETHMLNLSSYLLDTAVDFELIGDDEEALQQQEQEMYDNAGAFFADLARMPYDASFSLRAFLDCLNFTMQMCNLQESYKVDLVELGFGFSKLLARKRWVTTLENLLYNFNQHCKFMMPCKHQPPPMRYLTRFSNFRAPSNSTYMPYNAIYSPYDA